MQHSHLSNGTPLTIRPIRAEDAQSEQNFVRDLSPQARRFRFMGTLKELSSKMLAEFTQIDYGREMALIALTDENGAARQHGVARYYVNPDRTSCEFAIVVSDKLQGQGIGTRLMKSLMDAAREDGLKIMKGSIMASNVPMLNLMEELGFTTRPCAIDEGVVVMERRL